MAEFKYIMQGFSEKINFCDEIIALLKNDTYTEVYILTAFINDVAVYNLEQSIEQSKANITFVVGIHNGVTTYQALERLLKLKVNVYTFDTARSDSIFHVKTVLADNTEEAQVICGSANITTGGLINNVEAGIISHLKLCHNADKELFDEIKGYISIIISNYPENVKIIDTKGKITELRNQGLLIDEDKKIKNRVNVDGQCKGDSRTIVSQFPLLKRKCNFPTRENRQMDAIYRKVKGRTIEDVCKEVWKSKPLKKTHLGIVGSRSTHAKGEMSLGKGTYGDINPFTYFRKDVFGSLKWKKNKNGDEVAGAKFTLIISGINYGEYDLKILHKRQGMVAYKQKNYVTSIRWGKCASILKNEALLGRTLILLKSEEAGKFVLNIE